jgi:murein DD-endopeptidase MepM/ murein hydrolase activator NlpD
MSETNTPDEVSSPTPAKPTGEKTAAATNIAISAVKGAKVGGWVGAAAGAGLAAARTKTGKRIIGFVLAFVMILAVGVPVGSTIAFNSALAALAGGDTQRSVDAVRADNIKDPDMQAVADQAAHYGVPWEVALAIKQKGTAPDYPKLKASLSKVPRLGATAVYKSDLGLVLSKDESAKKVAADEQEAYEDGLVAYGLDAPTAKAVYTQALAWHLASKDDCNVSTPGVGGNAGPLVLEGSLEQRAVALMNWLTTNQFEGLGGKPMTREQAAGVAGNVAVESGINPSAVNELGCSGLFQWCFGRMQSLRDGATSVRVSWDDATYQMTFLAGELAGSHRSVAEQMLAGGGGAKTPAEWAKFWDDNFEISGNAAIDKRMSNATDFYNLGADGQPAPTVPVKGCAGQVVAGGGGHPLNDPNWPVSSGFGPRPGCDVCSSNHGGYDFTGGSDVCNMPIYSIADGTVVSAGRYGGYGNAVIISHGNGAFESLYAHQPDSASALWPVAGSTVKKGQLIGKIGTTGNSQGCHLHLSIRKDGVDVDPWSTLQGLGIPIVFWDGVDTAIPAGQKTVPWYTPDLSQRIP